MEKPTGLLSGQSSGPLSGYGTWFGYPDFGDIDDGNVAKPFVRLVSFGANTPGSSDSNDNRSAQGRATAPDVRPADLFLHDGILRCLFASVGPFNCAAGGGGRGGTGSGEESIGSTSEGDAAAPAAAGEATGGGAESEPGAVLNPYREGGGHHIPAKRVFTGDPNYDIKGALAIPNSELDARGVLHTDITGAQRSL